MIRTSIWSLICISVISCVLPMRTAWADNTCAYQFTSGTGVSFLSYCVTKNGNIPQIETPSTVQLIGPNSEGYGICNESPPQNYTDYGVSDTGNWNPATLVSHSGGSVKIARTTSDGNWTLTQTITKNPKTPSITVVMALTNNQPTDHIIYLVRFADSEPPNAAVTQLLLSGANGAVAWAQQAAEPEYGLTLENAVVPPPFGYMQPFVQTVNTGPNPCAFALNDAGGFGGIYGGHPLGSIEIAYVGTVKAGKTNTVTVTYRGL